MSKTLIEQCFAELEEACANLAYCAGVIRNIERSFRHPQETADLMLSCAKRIDKFLNEHKKEADNA